MVDRIPKDHPRVTPYLAVDGASDAIAFYAAVLGAVETVRMPGPTPDTVGHAELKLGESVIMLADQFEGSPPTPQKLGDSSVTLMVYVEDVDDVFRRALAAGASEIAPVTDQFYGDRSGVFRDPWGHRWNVASHAEDVTPEEMARRMSGG
jgi:PhnB protein